MKKRIILQFVICLFSFSSMSVRAYDFSAVAPTGQTLYYNISGSTVTVTYASNDEWNPYLGYSQPTGVIAIPTTVTHGGTTYSVISIGNFAFFGCSGLISVNIGGSITSIGNCSFQNCSGMTSVTIGNSVTSIGDQAFLNCGSLTSLTIPNSVVSIGENTFRNCNGLTTVTIGESVISIGSQAFLDCSGLTSVTIPNSVVLINDGAFWGCTGLTSVTFGSSVSSIGNFAFQSCSNIMSITIPNSVTIIGSNSFSNCSSMTSLTIGNAVASIGDNAFYYCTGLTEIICLGSVAPMLGGSYAFYNVPSSAPVYIPCGSKSSYQSAWTHFSNFVEPIPEITFTVQTTDTMMGTVNMMTQPTCDSTVVVEAIANHSYHFGHWSNGNITNPDTLHLVGDSMVTAYFIGLTVVTGDTERGTAMHDKIGECMERICAIPNYGYHFDHWSTGSTANPDTIYLVGDSTVTAYFTGLTVLSSDSERGTTSHIKIGDHLDRIIANPNYGYHFDHWSNGSTANPDTIHIVGDSTVIAFFERNTYHLSAEVNDASLGSLSMPLGDSALYQDTLMVVASPTEHYHVGDWYGVDIVDISANKDTVWVRMTNNCIVTCNFVINYYTVNVSSNDIVRGMVEVSGIQFAYGTPCTVTATAYTGYTFYGWSNGVTANPYTFAVVGNVELTALFVTEDEEVYTVTVVSADPAMGSVSGGGQAVNGGCVTIRATPNEGYRFLNWQDGNTENPRTVTVNSDITYTAYFESTTQGIFNVDDNKITVYPNPTSGKVIIGADDVTRIDVYNANGQLVKTIVRDSSIDISNLPSGVYTLKVETNHSTYFSRVIKK